MGANNKAELSTSCHMPNFAWKSFDIRLTASIFKSLKFSCSAQIDKVSSQVQVMIWSS